MSFTSAGQVTCEWCGTTNDSRSYKCILCDIAIGTPALDRVSAKNLDAAIVSTYTRGGASLVTERLVDGRLPFRNSWRERHCIRLSLAELLPELHATLAVDLKGDLGYTYLGWRWPESRIATQLDVGIYRGGRVEGNYLMGGRKVHNQRQQRYPKRRAENLHLSVPSSTEDFTVSVSLLAEIEGQRIGTHPRVVHSAGS